MVFSRIKHLLEDVFENIAYVGIFLLFVLFVLVALSPVVIPIVIGYTVFVVVSSGLDPVVKGTIFAVYSAGLFIYGGVLGFKACTDVGNEVKEALNMCEKKVLAVLDDVKKCRAARKAVESKVYDFMMCTDAIRRKL
jgi:hypothetical protein